MIIEVKESVQELRLLWRRASAAIRPRIGMLQLIKAGKNRSKDLAAKTHVSLDAIAEWKKRYMREGLRGLAHEGRGGRRNSPLTAVQMQQLGQRLSSAKEKGLPLTWRRFIGSIKPLGWR